jgi:hypothetical protein
VQLDTWTRADGAVQPQTLTESRTAQYPWSITADGKRLALEDYDSEGGYRLSTVQLANCT